MYSQRGSANMLCKYLNKKTESETKATVYEVLAQELHKLLIKKFKRRKVFGWFRDNNWAADLAEMASYKIKDISRSFYEK